jgi:hypothetical protein
MRIKMHALDIMIAFGLVYSVENIVITATEKLITVVRNKKAVL